MTTPPAELLEALMRSGSASRSLTLGLRKLVLEELAPCHEDDEDEAEDAHAGSVEMRNPHG